jgi:two-component system OmpR family sensor kinase
VLTAVRDGDDDATCVTGLPLSSVYDTLHELAVTELVVFGTVVLLACVLGTMWVGLSLRPLRRVAATAAQVAELPLESGTVELPAGVPDTDPLTETGQVGAAFNRMLGHVQSALARRTASESRLRRFAADASHELRTPLASIRGYAELALRHPGDSPEPVIHALNRVLSESRRMTVLVDDLLLLARLDAGRPLDSEPVDMSRAAIDATSDARVARPGHRWVLDLPDDPVMAGGDEHRLQQVLVNLLSNAGRHTPEGTTVTVKLIADPASGGAPHCAGSGRGSAPAASGWPAGENGEDGLAMVGRGTPPAGPRLVLSVTDDGPGIPADLLPELFERFTRADTARSHSDDHASTGLGLAIVDAVVAAHGGAVQVTSRPGLTRFAIILPRLAEPPRDEPQRRPQRTRKARV